MRFLFILIIALVSNFGFSQDLKCKDFKEGRFYIDIKERYDTLFHIDGVTKDLSKFQIDFEKTGISYKMNRTSTSQTEWIPDREDEGFTYEDIFWEDDCTYILKYNSQNLTINEDQLRVNLNGGLKVEILDIIDNCARYKATEILQDKSELYNLGFICKEL